MTIIILLRKRRIEVVALAVVLVIIILNGVDAATRQFILVFNQSLNFQQANAFCETTYGTKLATITSQADMNLLEDLMDSLNSPPHFAAWIGLNDISNEAGSNRAGPWEWISGSVYSFQTPWELNQPNSSGDCIIFNQNSLWDDLDCNTPNRFVCDDLPVNPRYEIHRTELLNYSQAELACVSEGGHLATIRNEQEQLMIEGMIGNPGTTQGFWIGLNDLVVEQGVNKVGDWRYNSGIQYTGFNNFAQGEPSGTFETDEEDCVEIFSRSRATFLSTEYFKGQWNDMPCNSQLHFICDKNLDALIITLSSSPTSLPTNEEPNELPLPAIIGGAVGGSVIVLIGAWFFCRRKSSNPNSGEVAVIMKGDGAPSAVATGNKNTKSPKKQKQGPTTISMEFERAENSSSRRSSFMSYMQQLTPTHYYHQSRKTWRNKSFKLLFSPGRKNQEPNFVLPTTVNLAANMSDILEEGSNISSSSSGIRPPPGLI